MGLHTVTFRVIKQMFLNTFQGPGGFREFREACVVGIILPILVPVSVRGDELWAKSLL